MSEKKKNNKRRKHNPIDKDKVTDRPSSLPYAHTVGSAVIKPEDKGKIKGKAMAAMVEQTDRQLDQIRKQIQVLAEQARDLQQRVDISAHIYNAQMNFEPVVGHTYYLYQKKNDDYFLSMLSPEEWGRKFKHEFVSEVKLLADHTWEVMRTNNKKRD